MLTRNDLVTLYRKHRNVPVLSIYLNAEEHDPAKRRAWRRALDHVIEYVERTVDASDRASYEGALAHVKKELRRYDAFLPDRGWVGFASRDALLYAETIPVPMPDLGRWEDGPHVAPYVRALKQARPVVSVIVDRRRARLFRYQDGQFAEQPEVDIDALFGDLTDIPISKRATTHTGVRGETATDVAQRLYEVQAERMVKHVAELIAVQAGADGFVVLGGTPEMVARTTQALHKSFAGRVQEVPALSLITPVPKVRQATEEAASSLTQRRHDARVAEVIDLARSGGRGCLGRRETERALLERRVELLALSRELAANDAEFADECVGRAFEQDADVVEVAGVAGARLDADGEGIGAKLRFNG
jgi:hypothetical protein